MLQKTPFVPDTGDVTSWVGEMLRNWPETEMSGHQTKGSPDILKLSAYFEEYRDGEYLYKFWLSSHWILQVSPPLYTSDHFTSFHTLVLSAGRTISFFYFLHFQNEVPYSSHVSHCRRIRPGRVRIYHSLVTVRANGSVAAAFPMDPIASPWAREPMG